MIKSHLLCQLSYRGGLSGGIIVPDSRSSSNLTGKDIELVHGFLDGMNPVAKQADFELCLTE